MTVELNDRKPAGCQSSLAMRFWLLGAALVAVTFIAHCPELRNHFIWDDPDYLTHNKIIQSPGGLWPIWTDPRASPQYYPLVFTTFWIEYHLWGLHPLGYHLDNILLQCASAVLLWIFLRRLKIPAAWLAAAIFAIHPLQVESVAWITERKNCLSGLFYFAALLAYFAEPRRFVAAILFFLAALLSKTVTATWPVAVAIILWWQHGRIEKSHLLRLIPLAVLGIAVGLITAHLEQNHVGATGRDFDWTLADRFIIAGHAVWFYALKLFWPTHLAFIYPQFDLAAAPLAHFIFALAAVAILLALMLLHRLIGRAPATVALLYVVTLFPALGFVNVYPMRYSVVADHFQYLACIPLIVPAAVLLRRLLTCRFAWLTLVPLIFLTWRQNRIYYDPMTLWTATVKANPHFWMAHTNLGYEYYEKGDLRQANEQYILAVQATPDEPDAWCILGDFYLTTHQPQKAAAAYRQTLILQPNHPGALFGMQKIQSQLRQ